VGIERGRGLLTQAQAAVAGDGAGPGEARTPLISTGLAAGRGTWDTGDTRATGPAPGRAPAGSLSEFNATCGGRGPASSSLLAPPPPLPHPHAVPDACPARAQAWALAARGSWPWPAGWWRLRGRSGWNPRNWQGDRSGLRDLPREVGRGSEAPSGVQVA
jgi:hypothetical protein